MNQIAGNFPKAKIVRLILAVIVAGAYVIFGITAFGAAMFTVPALSFFFPLDFVLPMCVLLDVSAALALGSRFSRDADRGELKWMAPCSLAGAVAGVTGSVIIAEFDSLAAARAWADADPYVAGGVWAKVTVHPFHRGFPRYS